MKAAKVPLSKLLLTDEEVQITGHQPDRMNLVGNLRLTLGVHASNRLYRYLL